MAVEMMRHAAQIGWRRAGGEDLKPVIDLQGIGVDDRAAVPLGQFHRQPRLAAGSGAGYQDRLNPPRHRLPFIGSRFMHVATLIAHPDGPHFSAREIGLLGELLGVAAAEPQWLAEGTAADLPLAAAPAPEAVAATRERAATLGLDLVVQEAAGRRKRFLIADMDSTMIEQECIDELAAEIGIKDKIASITARAMNGEIAFEPALRERVGLLAGLGEDVVETVIAERITYVRGGRTLIATMRAAGAHTALVSGGFTVFTGPIGAALGFHESRANRLIARDGRLTGEVGEPILGAEAKVAALKEIAAAKGLTPAETIAVGDGANDLPMLQLAGTGVALHAKPTVAARAPHRIDGGDLTALLYIQGYRRDEFVG